MLVGSIWKAILSHVPNFDYVSMSLSAGQQVLWWLQRQQERKTLTTTTFLATENKYGFVVLVYEWSFHSFPFLFDYSSQKCFLQYQFIFFAQWSEMKKIFKMIVHFDHPLLIWTTHVTCVYFLMIRSIPQQLFLYSPWCRVLEQSSFFSVLKPNGMHVETSDRSRCFFCWNSFHILQKLSFFLR